MIFNVVKSVDGRTFPDDRAEEILIDIDTMLEDAGFDIVGETEHIWKEFPEENGHSHNVLNVLCVKKENE